MVQWLYAIQGAIIFYCKYNYETRPLIVYAPFIFALVVSALNKAWCVNCFACSTCNTKLTLK